MVVADKSFQQCVGAAGPVVGVPPFLVVTFGFWDQAFIGDVFKVCLLVEPDIGAGSGL